MLKTNLHNLPLIRQSLLFSGLDDNTVREVLAHANLRRAERGEYLLTQGDKPTFMIFVLSGEVFTLRGTLEGNEIIIRMLASGDTCLDAILFPCDPSPVTVRVMKPSEVLCIDAAYLTDAVQHNIELANNLLYTISKHYRASILQIDSITLRDATYRVGRYLLSLSMNSKDNDCFDLTFKKSDIANYLGMTPETLSRSLKDLQKLGVQVKSGHVMLTDPILLSSFCDATNKERCICATSLQNSEGGCPHS